jgi:microbial collagenase
MGNGCTRSNISGNAGGYRYFCVLVPNGATQLKFESSGGSGNADMYVSASIWADDTHYDQLSQQAGNTESVIIAAPQGNHYYYVSLKGVQTFSGVVLKASFTP